MTNTTKEIKAALAGTKSLVRGDRAKAALAIRETMLAERAYLAAELKKPQDARDAAAVRSSIGRLSNACKQLGVEGIPASGR
jgi:hypothetical protein